MSDSKVQRLSLTGRLYLILTLTAASIFITFFIAIWWTGSNSLEAMLQQNGRSLAAGLQQNIRLGVQLAETDFVRDGAASVVANPDIISVDIYDANMQRTLLLKGEHESLSLAQLRSSIQLGVVFDTVNDGKQERIIAPIRTATGEVIGYSVVDLSRASINRTLASSLMISASISVLLLLLFWLLAWLAIRQLQRPLDELDEAVDAVASGKLDVSINADIPDPLARIACGFNNMTVALAKNQQAIRQYTNALEQSEQRFRELFTHMPVAMYMADIHGTLQQCNPAMAELFAYEAPQAMLDAVANMSELYEEPAERDLLIAALIRGPHMIAGREFHFVSKQGDVLQCLLYVRLVMDEQGRPQGVEGMIQDLTEFRLLEGNLLQAQKMEAVGQLAGGVAHDFNNLLSVILGNAELLSMHAAADDKSMHYADRIKQAGKRAAELTTNLLGFARKGTMRCEPVMMWSLLEEVLNLIRETCDRRVHVSLQSDNEGLRIMGDPGQLHQVFMNLAINALHAMPDGGELAVKMSFANGQVVVQVIDTGVGMSEKVLQKIFEPFFTTREIGKGTGLGLSMVYGLIEKQGGEISVDSLPGKGSCFEVRLPIYQGEGESVSAVHGAELELPELKVRVMLVDDEEMLRELGHEILTSSGLNVSTASSGEEALAMLEDRTTEFDVVLLDLNMPGMGGEATLREIRSRYTEMKVIILTGYSETTFETGQSDLRYDGFISKPYQPSDLFAEILRVLGK